MGNLTELVLRREELERRWFKTRKVREELAELELLIDAQLNPFRRELDRKIAEKLRKARL